MGAKQGCSWAALITVLGCLLAAILAVSLFATGEAPLYDPRLTGLEPVPSYAFQPTTPITLSFDQPMEPASVESAFSLSPIVAGTFHWNEERTQVVFIPAGPGFEPGTEYTARLTGGARASTLPRLTESGVEWRFSLPPLLEAQTPPPDARDVGAWPRLEAVFGYDLDCERTVPGFSIAPAVAGTVVCSKRGIVFRPTVPLAPDSRYTATVAQVFLKGDTSPRRGPKWQLRTAPPLQLVDLSPSAADLLADLQVPIVISFNRPVNAESVISRFSIRSEGGTQLPGTASWEKDGSRFVYEPEEPLHPATVYQITLLDGVYDELGFELADPVTFSFHTALLLGIPSPSPEARNVRLDSTIRMPFSREMDRPSVEAGLSVTPTLHGAFSWDGNTVIFSPRGGLAPETAYRVSIGAAVRDAGGAPLGRPYSWTFDTEALLADFAAPAGDPVLHLQEPVELAFALPMDRNSVQSALTISPPTHVEFAWTGDNRTLVLRPEPAWLPDSRYTVRLAGTARTDDGYQTLDQEYDRTFSTGVATVQFGYGPNLQILDALGDRTLQVFASGADVADLALYALTPTQLLDLYSSGFRGIGLEEQQTMGFAAAPPVAAWRDVVEPLDRVPRRGTGHLAQIHLPADVPPGMYALAGNPAAEEGGQLLVVVTGHALVLKQALTGTGLQAQAQVVAWDTTLQDGTPVVSSTVSLFERDGTLLAQAQTDDQGLAVLDVPGDPGPLIGLAEVNGDWTICGLSNEWSESGWLGWWDRPSTGSTQATYSYTDRPIYRPAQTVYFKNVIRADKDVSYTLPSPDLPVTVRVRDARDNVVSTQVLTPTQFGTVHGAFQLAEEPMLGTWNLETGVAGQVTRQPFKVEEYRKPEYEVAVSMPRSVYVEGEAISVTVEASYYYGEPVAAADVLVNVYPTYADEYAMGQPMGFGYPLHVTEGHTDVQGRWTVRVTTADLFGQESLSDSIQLAVEATVADDSGQTVSTYEIATVVRTTQGLSLWLERHGYYPEEEISFSAWVLDRDASPVDGAELLATVRGWDDLEVASATRVSGRAGEAKFSLRLPEQGWYSLHLSGRDDRGREMRVEDYLWVYDPSGQAPWYHGQWQPDAPLTVSADRTTYAMGDTVELLVSSTTSGPALLTLERGRTREALAIDLISGTNLITFPVRADYAPNIHVNVSQYGPLTDWWPDLSKPEAELHSASAEIHVPMTDRLLEIDLTADQEVYQPGDVAAFRIEVSDQDGQPVEAEVSLAVVDAAIYALAEDMSGDPFEVFYGPRPNLVRTYDSLRPTRWLWEEGPGLGGGEEQGGAPRRTFLDTAYWAPAVVTDESGEAIVTFDWPDNLTEWRAIARAVTTDTKVGQATTSAVVSKDVVVRPAIPRFLVQGDIITLTATVHNYAPQAVSATVDLDLEGPLVVSEEGEPQRHVVSIPSGGSNTVAWPVWASDAGSALVSIQATATHGGAKLAGADAVERTLPVRALAIPEVSTFSGILDAARPTATVTLTVPAGFLEEMGSLEIKMDSSVAPGLLNGLEYLIGYPFG